MDELERARGKFFARKGAKLAYAMMSVPTIIVTAVVAALSIAVGLSIPLIAVVAIVAYVVSATVQTFSMRELADLRNPGVSLDGLHDPYLRWALAALGAKENYLHAVEGDEPGPLQDRLRSTGGDIDDVINGLIRVAKRAQTLDEYLTKHPIERTRERLAAAQRRLDGATDEAVRDDRERVVTSLRSQLDVAEAMLARRDQAISRLESTLADLEALAAQIMDIRLAADESTSVEDPAERVDRLIIELDTVRSAVAELDPKKSDTTLDDIAMASETMPVRRRDEVAE